MLTDSISNYVCIKLVGACVGGIAIAVLRLTQFSVFAFSSGFL